MSKYILAKYAIDKFQKLSDKKMKIATSENNEFYRGLAHGYTRAADMLRMMDATNVQPINYARWIDLDDRIMCSGCGEGIDNPYEVKRKSYKCCPVCMARMVWD